MITDLAHAAEQLTRAAERIAIGDTAVICDSMAHPAWTVQQKEALLADLATAVRDRDAAIWQLLHGLPLGRRCPGCVNRHRPPSRTGIRGIRYGVCDDCRDEGSAALYRIVRQAAS